MGVTKRELDGVPSRTHNFLTIVDSCRRLREVYDDAPSYNGLWHLLATGVIPAERDGRVWKIAPTTIPLIAAHLGFEDKAA